jgi:hypothetical protein
MERISLEETWRICLNMWRWIVMQRKRGDRRSVNKLKTEWLEKHSFDIYIEAECFFCAYVSKRNSGCRLCPGAKVDGEFRCFNRKYHWVTRPVAFYEKIKELNRKRKKKYAK